MALFRWSDTTHTQLQSLKIHGTSALGSKIDTRTFEHNPQKSVVKNAMSIFFKRVPSSQNFHGAWIGAKKQCWKCSGVDFFIFRPGGSFAVLGARLKKATHGIKIGKRISSFRLCCSTNPSRGHTKGVLARVPGKFLGPDRQISRQTVTSK